MPRRRMAREETNNLPVYSAVAVEDEADNPFASATAVAEAMPTEYTATVVGVEIPQAEEQSSAHLQYRARMQHYQSQNRGANVNNLIEADEDWADQIASEMAAFTSRWGISSSNTAGQVRCCLYVMFVVLIVIFMFSLWLFSFADDSGALQNINSFIADSGDRVLSCAVCCVEGLRQLLDS